MFLGDHSSLPYISPYYISDEKGYIGAYRKIAKKKLTVHLIEKLRLMVCSTNMKILFDKIAETCFRIDKMEKRKAKLESLVIGEDQKLLYYVEIY